MEILFPDRFYATKGSEEYDLPRMNTAVKSVHIRHVQQPPPCEEYMPLYEELHQNPMQRREAPRHGGINPRSLWDGIILSFFRIRDKYLVVYDTNVNYFSMMEPDKKIMFRHSP